MKNVTIVKDTRQASKEDLTQVLSNIAAIFAASVFDKERLHMAIGNSTLAVRVFLDENHGDINCLHPLAREIMAIQ